MISDLQYGNKYGGPRSGWKNIIHVYTVQPPYKALLFTAVFYTTRKARDPVYEIDSGRVAIFENPPLSLSKVGTKPAFNRL